MGDDAALVFSDPGRTAEFLAGCAIDVGHELAGRFARSVIGNVVKTLKPSHGHKPGQLHGSEKTLPDHAQLRSGDSDSHPTKINNDVLGKKRVGSANKSDLHHAFPDLVDNHVGQGTKFEIPTKGPGGKVVRTSELYQVEGSLNGKNGVFEWIVDKGEVTHRLFIPNGKVTGFPNQVPKK